MEFCTEHWDALKEAIDERGLSHLIAKDGERAVVNLQEELDSGLTIKNFDPLMSSHWAIVSNVFDAVGLDLMLPDEDGEERCPLCFMNECHALYCEDENCEREDFDDWIQYAADDSLEAWEQLQAAERGELEA